MVDIKPVMFKYYKTMTEEDFYKPIAIIGCRRIPNFHLAWSQASLCYDQFVASIMSHNRFEGLMEFLHIVDSSTGNGLGYDIVFSLLKDFLDQWFSLCIDNFYTSPVFANDLFSHNTNTTGTLSINGKGIPMRQFVHTRKCQSQIFQEELLSI